ncbi:MAG: caspase family protein [Thermoguttaceae bacterium]|nr:caspase family protein [Thermoguttaceae bacterium]
MRGTGKKRAAFVVALGGVWALNGATVWAQISPGFANAVQQNLATQRQAEEAAARATVSESAPRASKVPSASRRTEAAGAGRVEALFIAAQNYDGAGGMPSLKGAANDVRLWKNWFRSAYGENGAATILCDVDDAELAATAAPSRENILDALKEKAAKECDRLIVTFSGNGVSCGGESFFCPIDVKGTKFDDVDAESQSAVLRRAEKNNLLDLVDALEILKNAKAKEVIVFYDACFGGLSEDLERRGGELFALTSCAPDETAKEIVVDGEKYGAFTYYFVEGLGGKADLTAFLDGRVTLNEAYDYAQSKLCGKQSPEFFGASPSTTFPTMARVEPDGLPLGESLAEVDQWSDAEFLLRCGYALSKPSYREEVLRLSERALNAVLANAPSKPSALELRGSVRRSLGDFEGALSDWSQVGLKLRLYVKSLCPAAPERGYPKPGVRPPMFASERQTVALLDDNGEGTGAQAETFDCLTVAKIRKDADGVARAYVTEKNDASLGEEAGWVALDRLTWDFSVVANGVNASKLRPNHSSALRLEVSTPRPPRLDAPLGNAPSRVDSVAPGGGPRPSRVLPRF